MLEMINLLDKCWRGVVVVVVDEVIRTVRVLSNIGLLVS
jgi:hypothetical protein